MDQNEPNRNVDADIKGTIRSGSKFKINMLKCIIDTYVLIYKLLNKYHLSLKDYLNTCIKSCRNT